MVVQEVRRGGGGYGCGGGCGDAGGGGGGCGGGALGDGCGLSWGVWEGADGLGAAGWRVALGIWECVSLEL